ncbi:FMN-binding split barrel [Cordyceps fumosorosea ARSEF 2679]|uniref:FMN-binding split barrel n=1 Tax=Cordyceps fumosorosea (strain ARSEF 2679) TaxID=1081104 RepID=A0A162IFN7_CORFA|nr:FMN-binding split barrel [Cordyceps fumosorosea ARSEF 2679]OAA56485.1 FMN-binding split barrel [Cordyceps fumosorosea ARSEF 2679]
MADSINRNPHPDFKTVEASRPDFDASAPPFRYTKTPEPSWAFGSGRNRLADPGASRPHVALDPHADGRPAGLNYKLLISAVTPRPIAFISTRSPDGRATNLAPFSYFNVVTHDPPIFVIGFSSSVADAKDTLRNLLDSKECVINIISETYLEAANAASIDAPFGRDEWRLTGLTPEYGCETVRCARVREAVFSVEAKLDSVREWDSRARPGEKSGTTVFVEGTRFWVREDALNADKSIVDPAVKGIELTRPKFNEDLGGLEGYEKLAERNP